MRILKFGGSSVANSVNINKVADILQDYHKKKIKYAVVFSAFGGVTDSLKNMAALAAKGDDRFLSEYKKFCERHQRTIKALFPKTKALIISIEMTEQHKVLKELLTGIRLVRETTPRTLDYVFSFGERSSAFIISKYLQQRGVPSEFLDARNIIITDNTFGAARVDFKETKKKIRAHFKKTKKHQVITGFISKDKGGLTTTLGRGGSDYTASILGNALKASIIEIWTDVDGVLTANPNIVKDAISIEELSYSEAMEMAHFGAKVIYPPTIQPALQESIPLRIKNTFNPTNPGTLIHHKAKSKENPVRGISSIGDIALLSISGAGLFGQPGIAAKVFSVLATAKINVILITQGSSEASISFAVIPSKAKTAKKLLDKAFEYEISRKSVNPIQIESNLSVIAIIGEKMRFHPGISGRLFKSLGKNGINVVAIAQGSSELNISVVINKGNESKALNALHESFFLSTSKIINLFVVGVGLIGTELISQINKQKDNLIKGEALDIRIIGMANSKKMLFNVNGLGTKNWENKLLKSKMKMDAKAFIEKMIQLNLPNSIFVDNTASAEISSHYKTVLNSSISISTPNKIAAASGINTYKELKEIANKRNVYWAYETNVGAGLPIISTIKDLLLSGDKIIKIEAVLSGTLSYIFNTLDENNTFSQVVKKAKSLGYTEPDPREDLACGDIKRKTLILAREIGLMFEEKDIKIQSILPKKYFNDSSISEFLSSLKNLDKVFNKKIMEANKKSSALRVIATIENNKGDIKLKEVGQNNPFYGLEGTDNMIVFTTERYNERHLVIRGPGAGATVTAAGIFSEIIKIANKIT